MGESGRVNQVKWNRWLLGVVLALAGGVPASAQDRAPVVLSAGWAPIFSTDFREHNLPGWYADVSLGVSRLASVAFDASGWYVGYQTPDAGGYFSSHAFVGGPRITLPAGKRLRVFGQMMAGTVILADGQGHSQSGVVLQPGGGIEAAIAGSRGFAVRVQLDSPNQRLKGDYGNYYWSRVWRVSAGIAYRRWRN